jgi:hypothetical protein
VFAGAEGADRPFVVEAIWECDVDRVDGRVLQEFWVYFELDLLLMFLGGNARDWGSLDTFVSGVDDGNTVLLRICLGAWTVSGCDCSDYNLRVCLCGSD